jgi:hypothetical protein
MKVTYTLKKAIGKRRSFEFDGHVYKGDLLRFEGLNEIHVVVSRLLSVPFDLASSITDVEIDTEIHKP